MEFLANVVIDGELWNYHVTKDGRVFSLNYRKTGKTKELSYAICMGYRYVVLHKDGKKKMVKIANLVAIAYIPNTTNKPTVDHINRDRTDDRVENLRWATYKEQIHNRKEYPKNREGSKPVKCVETGIVYPSAYEVQRQFGFQHSAIYSCCRGERKIAYGFHWQYV